MVALESRSQQGSDASHAPMMDKVLETLAALQRQMQEMQEQNSRYQHSTDKAARSLKMALDSLSDGVWDGPRKRAQMQKWQG